MAQIVPLFWAVRILLIFLLATVVSGVIVLTSQSIGY